MKINEDSIAEFKDAFRKDYNLVLGENEVKESAENLIKFFSLLARFDKEDKQKLMKMKG